MTCRVESPVFRMYRASIRASGGRASMPTIFSFNQRAGALPITQLETGAKALPISASFCAPPRALALSGRAVPDVILGQKFAFEARHVHVHRAFGFAGAAFQT